MSKKVYYGRIYVGRDGDKQFFHWVGRFPTRRERNDAVATERVRLKSEGCDCASCRATGAFPKVHRGSVLPTCDEYVDRYLDEYATRHKDSSYDTAKGSLKRFKDDFAGRTLDSITRQDAKEWVAKVPASCVPIVVTLFNHAIDEDDYPLPRNPFRGLGKRTKGRAEDPPPTAGEFQKLLDSCSALGSYAPMMRALLKFSAFTLMRPGELYELEWADIDTDAMRISKSRRVYRGRVAEPKTGKKLIALTPPARDAIIGLPREGRLVFRSKTDRRLSQSVMSGYWSQVKAKAGLEFDFYHATKHYGVHYMWTKLGMTPRVIAAQAGWSVSTVNRMLAIYGHGDVGALAEVDAAFESAKVIPLRDASVTQGGADARS